MNNQHQPVYVKQESDPVASPAPSHYYRPLDYDPNLPHVSHLPQISHPYLAPLHSQFRHPNPYHQFGPPLVRPDPVRSSPSLLRSNTPVEDPQSRKRARPHDSALDAGENELKLLALKAAKLPLLELALRIRSIENDDSIPETRALNQTGILEKDTSKERQRQIFGMVWLLNSCELSPTAVVPRNRIYARYVQVCADNSLTPLSPASFGKLVRILFPNLTTRRLGMRGQSKYHYCGIKLTMDQGAQGNSPGLSASSSFGSPMTPIVDSPSGTTTPLPQVYIASQLQLPELKYVPNLFSMIEASLNAEDMSSPLNLPSIYPYIPKDTDLDIADTLYSLYKVHCTLIFESLRYMHIKKLFTSFANFNSILTTPVFRLYTSESVIEWVCECDMIMYRTMAKMLTKLHLQSVPEEVLQQLKQVSKQYVAKLLVSLQTRVPKAFLAMKLKNARAFISILLRLIRVIETGQAATRILHSPQERLLMLDDWNRLDLAEIVYREVPCPKENVDTLLHILTTDVALLFQTERDAAVLGDVAQFVQTLPSRLTRINPRLFILVSSNLLTTCLREISLNGGLGFGAWWIVRCWTDEYLCWCFELGGFLKDEYQRMQEEPVPQQPLYEEPSSDLRSASMVDLLDGAYGGDFKESIVLNYENLSVENILGRSDDLS